MTRKERRQEQAREEILDAARQVLLDRGLAGFTLAAVARELQLTKAALYYYFASKEVLVFEIVYRDLHAHAEVVGDAVDATTSGAAALEALIRSSSGHYGDRKDQLRLAYLVPQVGGATSPRFTPEMLQRVRPFNDRMYGAVAQRIRRDQEAGRVPEGVDGRRLAFLAHTSVIGMLTVEGLVEVADDAPLIHSREAMVDELVRTFRARLAPSP
ncbi:MAG: TetR/AcrR family transcriptional regulator [Deltaproteobacteria bacterium]|nr:MAG: TetR/AcrR family transcriptional regulator [Deltaproteobacteria bacterium]